MDFKIIKISAKYLIYYFIYKTLLDILYVFWVSPTFSYMGLTLDVNFTKYIVSSFIILFISTIIPKGNKKVSHIIIQIHYIITIIPVLSIYALSDLSTKFMSMIIISFLIQLVLLRVLPQMKVKKIKNGNFILYFLIIVLTLTTYGYLFITQPININALSFSEIYSIRAEQNISHSLMKYLLVWQYRIINPFVIVLSFLRKKYLWMYLVITFQFILYLLYPHKEVVLALGLILVTLYGVEKRMYFDKVFLLIFSSLSLVGTIIYSKLNYLMLFAIFPVRMLSLPAIIKFEHYEFFSVNTKLNYSEGMIGEIFGIDYPYSVASGVLVNPRGGNSNTGFIAYAYDNTGFLGMIIMSIIFVLFLKLVDSLAEGENKGVIFSLFVYPMIILNDGDLLTMLLTGGLWLLILILFLYKNIDDGVKRIR